MTRRLALDRHGIWAVLAAGLVLAAVLVPGFADPANLANVVRQAGVLGILAIGQTFVIAAGLIDLSIGMIAGLVVVVGAMLIDGDAGLTLPVALLMLLLGGALLFEL